MAFLSSSSSSPAMQKGIFVSVPVLVLSVSFTAAVFFLLSSSLSSCSCPSSISSRNDAGVASVGGNGGYVRLEERISPTREDIEWVRDLIRSNGLHMQKNELRKGINPRTRDQQLVDLKQYKGISHYEGEDHNQSSEEEEDDDLPKVESAFRSTGYPRGSRRCRRRRGHRLTERYERGAKEECLTKQVKWKI